MRLNKIEFLAMNNPIRRLIQLNIEFRQFNTFLKKYKIDFNNGVILDAGCGSGFSTKLLSKYYNPKELVAFDYMPEQIKIAKKKNPFANYFVGDITNIDQITEKFDAVFVFGILHHVPGWEKAIQELYRVIKKGGTLLIWEVNEKGVSFVDRYLKFNHPEEARFTWKQFSKALKNAKFNIVIQSKLVFDCFRSYLCTK